MLEAIRVTIRAYTASFRPPGIAGYQPTLPAPPLSTVYGLLAAAVGHDVDPQRVWVGYRFQATAQAEDLEKIIPFGTTGPEWKAEWAQMNTVPIKRQFLYEPRLELYVPQEAELEHAFLTPRFPLLLGRSQDVAYVERLDRVPLQPVSRGKVEGVLLPFPVPGVRSQIYSLPTYLPTHPPRKPLAVKPFQIVIERGEVALPDLLYQPPDQDLAVPIYTYERLI